MKTKERKQARETLMQMLYTMEAQRDFSDEVRDAFLAEYTVDASQQVYFANVHAAFVENKDAVDEIIESASEKWHISRMAKVDLAILRLCVTEMKFANIDSVPENVAISEAVNLAKKFGSDESAKFINGILGKISRADK